MTIFAAVIYKNQQGMIMADQLIQHVTGAISSPKIIKEANFKMIYGIRHNSSNFNKIIEFGSNETNLNGFVIGRLFEKSQSCSKLVKNLDQAIIAKIVQTEGKYLSQNYWGQYSLFIHDKPSQKFMFFPEPLGFTSLYYATINDNIIISSDVWCIKDILGKLAPLDDNYLKAIVCNLIGDLITTSSTAFIGIKEVTQNLALLIDNSQTIAKVRLTEFWDQFSIKPNASVTQDDILSVYFDVLQAHKRESNNICLHLSGGLDSSSLLMSLNHLSEDKGAISAITYSNELVASSNEFEAAKKVADFCRVNLQHYPWQKPWNFDFNTDKYNRLDRPHAYIYNSQFFSDVESMVSGKEDVVFWDGHGGDQMFYEGMINYALADRFIDHKFSDFISHLLKACKVNRKSIPFFLKNTLKALYRYYLNKIPEDESFTFKRPDWFLAEFDIEQYEDIIIPPILQKCRNIHPGKAAHIISIYEGPFQLKLVNKLNKIPTIYPYYSQPLVEMILSMPVYDLYNENYSRAPFREAIGNFFNTDLVFRRSKGETSGVLQLGMKQNINRVKELCLDGYFARNKFIDRQKLENNIAKASHGIIDGFTPILTLLSIESWLYSWNIS